MMPEQTTKPATVALKLDRPCKVCGCALSIAPDIKDGKAVAVDVNAEHRIYFLVRDKDGNRYAANAREFLWSLAQMRQGDTDAVAAMVAGVEGVGVGHAATCSGPKEGKAPAEQKQPL
jgi:hypothetical protein